MNKEMFLKITERLHSPSFLNKENLLIADTGLYNYQIKDYFKNAPVKRCRAYVDMKKYITSLILNEHNIYHKKNINFIYTLQDVADTLLLDSHSSVMHYIRNKKNDDKFSKYVKERTIDWIKNKKYPVAFKDSKMRLNFVLLNLDELKEISFSSESSKRINYDLLNKFMTKEKREIFINESYNQ
jgi:ABC-type iron transport system FetAB ATPase subunit